VKPPKGMVSAPFGLKTGIDFAHFGLESGRELLYRSNSPLNKKGREIWEFEIFSVGVLM